MDRPLPREMPGDLRGFASDTPYELTPRQLTMLHYIIAHGKPALRETAKHFGFASWYAVHCYFTTLLKKGWLKALSHGDGMSRSVELADKFPVPLPLPIQFCPCCGDYPDEEENRLYRCQRCGWYGHVLTDPRVQLAPRLDPSVSAAPRLTKPKSTSRQTARNAEAPCPCGRALPWGELRAHFQMWSCENNPPKFSHACACHRVWEGVSAKRMERL